MQIAIVKIYFIATLATILVLQNVHSECPNACNGNGICNTFDVCLCYKNWIGNDCSLRMCQFGLAHVDSPIRIGKVQDISLGRNDLVYNMFYPYGRQTNFPVFTGPELDSNLTLQSNIPLRNTGHGYAECSNKGICDRALGSCSCMPGFEGSACQRNVCPKITDTICNSHGRCVTARYIANKDYHNVYNLWDADISMGCLCDPGFYGAICEQRTCQIGYDPLYFDLDPNSRVFETSRRYSNWTIIIATKQNLSISGKFSIRFYDYQGKEWLTKPIAYDASCLEITDALESLPNKAIHRQTVRCIKWTNFTSSKVLSPNENFGFPVTTNYYHGTKYSLSFPNNPGRLRQIEINTQLTGKLPTLRASDILVNGNGNLKTFVYSDGFSGETEEYFTSKCAQVDVSIDSAGSYHYLSDLTDLEKRLLAQCLGEADSDPTSFSIDGKVLGARYSWDYGTKYNPHLIRLVPKLSDSSSLNTDMCLGLNNSIRGSGILCETPFPYPPGFYVPLIYDPDVGLFILMTRPASYYTVDTLFTVFTTDGFAQMVNDNVTVFTDPDRPYSQTIYTAATKSDSSNFWVGQTDCASTVINVNNAMDCVEKGKLVFVLDPYNFANNPVYMNIYKVNKIDTLSRVTYLPGKTLPSITLDVSMNAFWNLKDASVKARIYVFNTASSFQYVTECSGRGLCNPDTGLCQCYIGYYGGDCGVQDNALQQPFIITSTVV